MIECCGVEVIGCNMAVVALYRIPSGDFERLLNRFSDILELIYKDDKLLVIAGELNINFSVVNGKIAGFLDLIRSFNLDFLIREPTCVSSRNSTCIDNIAVNKSYTSSCSAKVVHTLLSDHFGQLLTFPFVYI